MTAGLERIARPNYLVAWLLNSVVKYKNEIRLKGREQSRPFLRLWYAACEEQAYMRILSLGSGPDGGQF